MATNREEILRGIRFLSLALPLIFTAPGLFYILGIPAWRQGSYWWTALCVVMMIVAVYLAVRGLKAVLRGFFSREKE